LVAVVLGQHLVVLATSWVTALLTLRVTRSAAAALAAWALCAISTARPLFANWVLTETLATALLTLSVWRLIVGCDTARLRPVLAGAVWLGLGVLVRPSLLAAAPAWLVAGWIVARRQSWPVRNCLLAAVAGPAVLAACLLPWCLRNAAQFDRFALTVFTGRELWTAQFSPWPGGELPIPTDGPGAELRGRMDDDALDLRHNISVSNALRQSGLDDAQTDALMERVAWQAIAANPGRAAFRTVARCATFWYVKDWEIDVTQDVPSADNRGFDDAQRRWLSSPLQSTVVAALRWTPERWFPAMWAWSVATWLGVAALVWHREQRAAGWVLAVILASTTVLTAGLEIPLYRYRCVLEPLTIVATVAAGQAWVRSVRRPAAA
jgi:hypothetical protein